MTQYRMLPPAGYFALLLLTFAITGVLSYLHWEYVVINIYRDAGGHRIIWSTYAYTAIIIFVFGCIGFLLGTRLFKQQIQVRNTKVKTNVHASNTVTAALKGAFIDRIFPSFVEKYETNKAITEVKGHRVSILIMILAAYILLSLISYYSMTLIYYGYGKRLWSTYYLELSQCLGSLTIGIILGIIAYSLKVKPLGTEYTPM